MCKAAEFVTYHYCTHMTNLSGLFVLSRCHALGFCDTLQLKLRVWNMSHLTDVHVVYCNSVFVVVFLRGRKVLM